MMITNVKEQFSSISGVISLEGNDLVKSQVEASIEVGSINTHNADRDAHLKSADFFDEQTFPTLLFSSTCVSPHGDGELTVEGNLTIRGVTRLSSDGELIRLTLEGQTECFTELMDRHLGAIRRRIGFMLRDNGAADDVAQEVVLKAWRFLSTFRAESSFRTWLTRVAINEVRQFERRERASRFQELPDFDVLATRDESPYDHLARIQRAKAVREVVNSLPVKYREVVMLRELDELSLHEIADRLRCTIPTVKSRLFRGRSMLLAGVRKSRPQLYM